MGRFSDTFNESHWWEDHSTLVSVIDFADEVGEFTKISEVVTFLEKPWKFESLYQSMRQSVEVAS